ncbi:MAG: type I restriction endonuclease subunit R [Candidatus Humimicrobiaceae bacterium]
MSPKSYIEQDFEEHIEQNLIESGYHKKYSEDYNKDQCIIPSEVITFIKSTHPKEFENLQIQYGADTENKICYRLSQEISQKGALEILRKGFKDRGSKFRLAYYKPSSGLNPEARALYTQNRFSVIRQLKFSTRNVKSLDMVIFLNGIPIITAELKNSLTGQFVEQAIKQYKNDRDPKEALFKFKRCLVHFAVGNEKVFMATKLAGADTKFLPFNKDTENPVNPNGHKTAYLWEDILQPDTLLDLINNYLHIQEYSEKYFVKDIGLEEKVHRPLIFPRYHQLDSVRKILDTLKSEGVGKSYLIEHSAGSGKSNSIAWLAHHLANFYQKSTDKDRLFDSIIVVTDRRVLDRQLQNTIKQFEQTAGVVVAIDKDAKQLKQALESSKDIIISTIQKFPVISEQMTKLSGKRFAVIVDEAHSGQQGEDAKHLKKVLSVNLENAEDEDRVEFNLDDEVLREISLRGKQPHISYFAFTATPKNKTLEMFGRKSESGQFCAFHTYSMRQAIEEHFILDVLKNYMTYKRYFKLMKTIAGDKKYEKRKAAILLTSYVDLQPHAIEAKTQIMIDHFIDKTTNQIQGKARAMVVTRSRLHAVRYYLEFKKQMKEKNLDFKPLVAFSGTVIDPDTLAEHTENSLNRLAPKVAIQDAFKTPEFRILIVAEKFQTGYDEPLLHTMFVDKKLVDLHAVQTLSRLNRVMDGKEDALIIDFVNEVEDIKNAFQPYYQTILLSEETDPNELYSLVYKLEKHDIYTDEDIEQFCKIFFNPAEELEKLQPILDRAVEKWNFKHEDEQEDFRITLQKFIRLYGFISQIVTFKDVDLEKLYNFGKNLLNKLPRTVKKLPYELKEAVDLESFRIQQTFKGSLKLEPMDGQVKPPSTDTVVPPPDEEEFLTKIIATLNETYGANLTDEDKVDIDIIKSKLEKNEELKAVLNPRNTRENIKKKFEDIFDNVILDFVNNKFELYKKLSDPQINSQFKKKWFDRLIEQHGL